MLKIPYRYEQFVKIADTSTVRYGLGGVHLEPTGNGTTNLVATDGVSLIFTEIDGNDIQETTIDAAQWKEAMALAKRTKGDVEIERKPNGYVTATVRDKGKVRSTTDAEIEGQFPQWEKAIPQYAAPRLLRFKTSAIRDLLDVVAKSTDDEYIDFVVETDEGRGSWERPVTIRSGDVTAVIAQQTPARDASIEERNSAYLREKTDNEQTRASA